MRSSSIGVWAGTLGLVLLMGLSAPMPAQAQVACPAGCDDANSCTDDLCDPNLGCVHFNNSTACSDGNTCTLSDVCNSGLCVGGAAGPGCSACQAAAAIPPQGGTFVGSTTGTGTLSGTCGTSLASPERVYQWRPSTSGVAMIGTCGTATNFDSVVYLRNASCTGTQVSCNDDAPCATSGTSDQGSRITPTVTAGTTYYIVVDGYNGARGNYSLTVQPPAACGNGVREGAEACDGADSSACTTGQCTAQCACVPPASGLPDLRAEIVDWRFDRGTSVAQGDVTEGCAEALSGIDLLRFGVRVRNAGTAPLYLGDPGCPNCVTNPLGTCTNPSFQCSPAAGHNHPHYSNYARYELLDQSSQAVVVGHKQGFCLTDSECSSSTPRYQSCYDQGISAGCADVYDSGLGCQYLDITGVPSGNYTLRVTVDPFGRIPEGIETNNAISVAVTIPGPGVADSCTSPASIPAAGGVITGTTTGALSTLTSSCGSTGSSPEKVFEWIPTVTGTATIQTCSASGTSFDTVLYLRGTTCQGGTEATCNDDTSGCASSSGASHASRITPAVTAGQKYYIVVDGYQGANGNFSLTVTPPNPTPPPPPPGNSACTNPTVVPAAGGVFTGATSGTSTLSGGCGNTAASPERVFQWTPARSGTATIQTCGASGTNFDSVLYLRGSTCTGSQISCNDDTNGCAASTGANQASRLQPVVTAGTTYFIVVDGYQGASGNFSLTITQPP